MCTDLWERRSSLHTCVASLDGKTSQLGGSEEWELGLFSPLLEHEEQRGGGKKTLQLKNMEFTLFWTMRVECML